MLLPDSKPTSPQHNPLHQYPKSILKPVAPPATKPRPTSPLTSAPKIALMPPTKQALPSPPLPPPKPTHKPLPPLPPLKPHSPTSPSLNEQLQQPTNGREEPPSPLRSLDECKAPQENGDAGLESELEVGSMVEVNDPPLFGVVRWIGSISGISEQVAGIELVSTRKGWQTVWLVGSQWVMTYDGNVLVIHLVGEKYIILGHIFQKLCQCLWNPTVLNSLLKWVSFNSVL